VKTQLEEARIKQKKYDLYKTRLMATTRKEDKTRDGQKFEIMGNIELPFEAEFIKSYNAGGIGLFRTEFLLGNREVAGNDSEQEIIYRNIAKSFYPHPVVIRTFDIGRDKGHPFITATPEENPSLGTMSIRLFLREKDLLISQLRAIIKANTLKNIRLLLPMITEVEEIVTVRKLIREIEADLPEQGHRINTPEIGIMIEVPAAVKLIKRIADLVDFFSIGTNDLMQYILAVDRNNSSVSYLYNPFHPAVVEVMKEIRAEAAQIGHPVTVCGEMAGKVFPALMLLGMGYRSFSMVPMSIPKIKNIFTSVDVEYMEKVTRRLTKFRSRQEIEEFIIEAMFKKYPRLFSNELVW
jgi:phosphoenolpyruvate-protein kinase (PTS system EI component)